MVEQARTASPAVRSRRLDSEREQAILRAAYELLSETGYQGLRVDAVAARAQASKATLYRHWPTKAELVTDAVRTCKAAEAPLPDTGSLRGDLLAWFDDMACMIRSEEGPLLAGLFMALHTDPELAAQLRRMRESKIPFAETICARGEARGELRPGYDTKLIDEIVPAVIFMRGFALGESVDQPYLEHLVDDIILPLLRR
ncbi:TetR/AcrR family transcriptional regulator [Paractinoplanes brasiliensis]|uniref:TetR family transcriptional regulator n=1 Tax=Paractinoplanes brasiliensis TaxID=52695 RepID=A0A4R6K3D2_9ACTN|nr:TetR/AcrR family transcriptional regulator [Actinoplanes brasiliensis]TDO41715.1 TetR family transcriptional regulator [Actinoplanes brasiliensis]GID33370.1 TetR family transcriptional regulator [Actinoplanes brasiliensis]